MLSRQHQPHHRGDDRERITRARQAAEALFTSKPPVSTPTIAPPAPADPSGHKPRVLQIIPPAAPARHDEPVMPAPPTVEIPRPQMALQFALVVNSLRVGVAGKHTPQR